MHIDDSPAIIEPPQARDIDLTSVLLGNDPPDFEKKFQDDIVDARDPIVDHLMQSGVFKFIF